MCCEHTEALLIFLNIVIWSTFLFLLFPFNCCCCWCSWRRWFHGKLKSHIHNVAVWHKTTIISFLKLMQRIEKREGIKERKKGRKKKFKLEWIKGRERWRRKFFMMRKKMNWMKGKLERVWDIKLFGIVYEI